MLTGNPHAEAPRNSVYLDALDSTTLHLRVSGHGGMPCVLLHGSGEGSFVWESFAAAIGTLCRTIAMDLRGHGDSAWSNTGDYSTNTHAADVLHIITKLTSGKILLIGHSLGAAIACRVAILNPAVIAGLIIVDYAPGLEQAGRDCARQRLKESMRTYATIGAYEHWLAQTRPLVSATRIRSLAAHSLRRCPDGYRPKLDPVVLDNDPIESDTEMDWLAVQAIRCPVLLVRGIASALLRADVARRLVHALPGARLRTIEHAGHAVMIDNPADFESAVIPFMEELCLAASGSARRVNS